MLYDAKQIRTANMLPDRSADIEFLEPTITKQSFADECDINNIVASNASFKPLTPEEYAQLNFADLGDGLDFQYHQNYMAEATSAFNRLPANERERFENDPARFLDFFSKPENTEEAIALGYATRRPMPPSEQLSEEEPDMIPNPNKKTPKKPAEQAVE